MPVIFKSTKEKVLALIFAALLVLVILDKVVFEPTSSRLASLNASISAAEQQLNRDRMIFSRRDVIQKQYKQLAPSRTSSRKGTDDDWLASIEKAVVGSVTIQNITPLPAERRQTHDWDKVEIFCTGTLDNLTQFIFNLQQGPNHPSVRRMRIRAADDPAGILDCHLEIMRMTLQ